MKVISTRLEGVVIVEPDVLAMIEVSSRVRCLEDEMPADTPSHRRSLSAFNEEVDRQDLLIGERGLLIVAEPVGEQAKMALVEFADVEADILQNTPGDLVINS